MWRRGEDMERKDVCPARTDRSWAVAVHILADWKSPSVVNRRKSGRIQFRSFVEFNCPLGLQFLRKLLTFLCCSGDVAA